MKLISTISIALLASLVLVLPARAQLGPPEPRGGGNVYESPRYKKETSGVDIIEKLDTTIPLDLEFKDEAGRPVKLQDYFTGKRPVVIQLGYFTCPSQCGEVDAGLVRSMNALDLDVSKDFELLYVSINPKDDPAAARKKKDEFLTQAKKLGVEEGWHLLTGSAENSKKLADALGFGYNYLPQVDQFAHPSAIMVLTPGGKVARYLYGMDYPSQTLRLSLVEASEGKIGSIGDRFMLTLCYSYDDTTGKYTATAYKIMRTGGVLTMLILGFFLVRPHIREYRARHALADHSKTQTR